MSFCKNLNLKKEGKDKNKKRLCHKKSQAFFNNLAVFN